MSLHICSPSIHWAHSKTVKADANADFIDYFIS